MANLRKKKQPGEQGFVQELQSVQDGTAAEQDSQGPERFDYSEQVAKMPAKTRQANAQLSRRTEQRLKAGSAAGKGRSRMQKEYDSFVAKRRGGN